MLAFLAANPWRTAFLLLALQAAATGWLADHYRNQRDAEHSAAVQIAAGLTSANLTIDQLAEANDQLQQLAAAQRGAVARAVKSLAETERKLQESRTKLRAREDADRAIPECEALLRTDLGVCPGHVDGLRRRASGL